MVSTSDPKTGDRASLLSADFREHLRSIHRERIAQAGLGFERTPAGLLLEAQVVLDLLDMVEMLTRDGDPVDVVPVPLVVDPARHADERYAGATGIYVRAEGPDGWAAHDVATLTYDSLVEWLRSRGGRNTLAEGVVAVLLGYDRRQWKP